uniref:Clone EM76 ribosomal protein S2-like n=1 Tax=Pseudomonas aeruginosa TaxID=287 RepID=Q51362_PSEAI|nr:similar to S. platensis ribosomal protein S2, Swiss-Prot Accession Number P34831 [Pseudomonas aeruginosa PAO1]
MGMRGGLTRLIEELSCPSQHARYAEGRCALRPPDRYWNRNGKFISARATGSISSTSKTCRCSRA